MIEKTDKTPIWVFLAFSSIEKRRTALLLIYASALFSIYCIPWAAFTAAPAWVGTLFVIDDWSWFAMMVPVTAWYWLSLRWVDNNSTWNASD